MADYALFYNSVNGDRVYDAEDFTEWLKPFFVTGVFNGGLQVTATSGMNVDVSVGYVNIGGKVRYFDEVTSLRLDNAHSTLDRIDNIVIRRNDVDRDITILVQKGTQSTNPVAPEPVRENETYDLVIAQIYVAAAATSITQANITDTRPDSSLCGWVVATVEEIDFAQITAQWQQYIAEFYNENQQDFNTWYQHIKDEFAEDVPGTLQTEIDEINQTIDNLADVATSGSYNDLIDLPTMDATLSDTSENAVQNKVVKQAIDGKADSSHTHTKSEITDFPTSMTPTSHTHGNIQNGGTLQSNDITIANGDKLVVTDSSDSNKVARTSIAFDGSTTTQFLTKKGTWATPTGAGTQITQDTTFNISGTTFKITTA